MKVKFSKYPCDICGSNSASKIKVLENYNKFSSLHICNSCGLVYCNERRNQEELKKEWGSNLYKNKFDRKTYDSSIPAVIARLTYAFEFLKNNTSLKNKKICDVGAGKGEFLDMFKNLKNNNNLYGVELSKENCSLLKKKKIKNFMGPIEDFPLKQNKNTFDIISLNWTLEAMQFAKKSVQICHQLLKKNGLILVSTGSRILVPFKKPLQHYMSDKNFTDIHPYHFSVNSLKVLLKNNGFDSFVVNSYIDTDYLCIIAKKTSIPLKQEKRCDDSKKVKSFFQRWHKESLLYK